MFGDLYQLKPVFGAYIFHSAQPFNLWTNLFQMKELTENKRQQNDVEYASMLNRIRTGTHTACDIKLLKTKLHVGEEPAAFNSILHIFPTKLQCKIHNEQQLDNLNRAGAEIHCITAEDLPPHIHHGEDPSGTAGLHKQLRLSIGARVMLLRNIDTATGLVNGAQGTITAFQWESSQRKEGELPQSVSIKFDDPTAGQYLENQRGHPVHVKPISVSFISENISCSRTQLPLIIVLGNNDSQNSRMYIRKSCC